MILDSAALLICKSPFVILLQIFTHPKLRSTLIDFTDLWHMRASAERADLFQSPLAYSHSQYRFYFSLFSLVASADICLSLQLLYLSE